MSFATSVKNEITKQSLSKAENLALLSAYFNTVGLIANNKIKLQTENAAIARNVFKMIKDIYHITPLVKTRNQANFKNNLYIIEIYDLDGIILEDLSLVIDNKRTLVPRDYLVDDEDTIRAYLAGVFLAKGSINDPKTARYHLEIILDDESFAKFVSDKMNRFDLNAKIIKRNNHQVVYVKESEKISDFLRIIYAHNAVMYYEDIRIYRDHKNMTNRLNNCEQANVDKIIKSSEELLSHINIIKKSGSYDNLNDSLKITIDYKVKYPDTSLAELAHIISVETGKEVTKSGLNHRFRRIKEIASKVE